MGVHAAGMQQPFLPTAEKPTELIAWPDIYLLV